MARVTQEDVEGIIENDEELDMTPFITAATALVDRHCATKTDADDNPYYTDDELGLIELWLAAHCFAIRAPRAVSEQAGPVMERVQSQVDLGFDVTHYGQMAMRLDAAGGLAALNEATKKGTGKPEIWWLGTPYDEEEE